MNEEQLAAYTARKIKDLKNISAKWAYGENVDKLVDYWQHPQGEKSKIFIVNLQKLIDKTELLDFNIHLLFTGDEASDFRVATTLKRWENGQFVDPPIISFSCQGEGKLTILDGRHRTKLAFHLGCETIPIAISIALVNEIAQIIELKPS